MSWMYRDPILMTEINTIRDFRSRSTLSAELFIKFFKILKDQSQWKTQDLTLKANQI